MRPKIVIELWSLFSFQFSIIQSYSFEKNRLSSNQNKDSICWHFDVTLWHIHTHHAKIHNNIIKMCLVILAVCPKNTFWILTKRPNFSKSSNTVFSIFCCDAKFFPFWAKRNEVWCFQSNVYTHKRVRELLHIPTTMTISLFNAKI